MVHNFNDFLTHQFLLQKKILERAEGDFYPEADIEISAEDIEGPPGDPGLGAKSADNKASVAASKVEPESQTAEIEYTVKSGDSLSKIALAFGMKVTDWQKIYALNKGVIGNDPNRLRVGMKLKIPVTSSTGKGSETGSQKDASTKEVQISDKTNSVFLPKIKNAKSAIDSNRSKVLFSIDQKLGCATFVNQFSDAVNVVGDAWKARDVVDGTMIYDIFSNLTKDQIATCINLWNSIYLEIKKNPQIKFDKDNLGNNVVQDIKKLVESLLETKQLEPEKLKIGDICGIYFPPSSYHGEAFYEAGKNYFTDQNGVKGKGNVPGRTITSGSRSWTMNTHVGIVGAIENGKPVIFHAIPQNQGVNIWADGIDKIHGGGKIVWVKRPKLSQQPIVI